MRAIVKEIIYKDTESELLYSIKVARNVGGVKTEQNLIAFPLDTNIKRIPVVGEVVSLITDTSPSSSPNKSKPIYYYSHITSLQKNINHNALPQGQAQLKGTGGSTADYQAASAGNPNASSTKPFSFEAGFEEVKGVSALQPFTGDILLEGRFGQSIRLGYTPSGNTETTQSPSWTGLRIRLRLRPSAHRQRRCAAVAAGFSGRRPFFCAPWLWRRWPPFPVGQVYPQILSCALTEGEAGRQPR